MTQSPSKRLVTEAALAQDFTTRGLDSVPARLTTAETDIDNLQAADTVFDDRLDEIDLRGAGVIYASDYGVVGDGVTNDKDALTLAVNALHTAGKGTLVLSGDIYISSPGTVITLNALSNVSIYFTPGSRLLINNLNAGSGTGHGIYVKGAGSNIKIINARIEWVPVATVRSTGDSFRFTGYPSDAAPPGGWTETTGLLSNVQLLNCQAKGAPQTGAIFMGCSDIYVSNFRVETTKADGLHFNACRRININGYTAFESGDDSLAFVTYYDAALIYSGTDGPFYQPSVGEWSNSQSVATNIVSKGSLANGVRIAGSQGITLSNVHTTNPSAVGLKLDSAIVGAGITWTYHASREININNFHLEGGDTGIESETFYIDSTSGEAFYKFDMTLSNGIIRGANNWSINVTGIDNSDNSRIEGINFHNIKVINDSPSGGGNGNILFRSLYNSSITDIHSLTAAILFYGHTGTADPLDNNVNVDNLYVEDSPIQFYTVGNYHIGSIYTINSMYNGVYIDGMARSFIDTVVIYKPNRINSGTIRAIMINRGWDTFINSIKILHDANTTTDFRSLEIGGGYDASHLAARNLYINEVLFVNTINSSSHHIAQQGGSWGPSNYGYTFKYYNGGEASPIWRIHEGGDRPLVDLGRIVYRTSAQIQSATDMVNTTFKQEGRECFDTSLNRPLWATGSNATDTWVDSAGVVVHTPV